MAQINVNRDPRPPYDSPPAPYNTPPAAYDSDGSRAMVSSNLTWAIAMVLIIAALAIAIVYVAHSVHF